MVVKKMPTVKRSKPRVCAYVRVSTNRDEQEYSFAVQSKYWEEKFRNDSAVEYVGLFTDDGISGKYMKNRKGLNAILTKVRAGEIDRVYTKSISRFARNYTEITAVIREFRDLGVPIIFEKENLNTLDPTSGLILSVMSSLAEEELVSMSKNQAWATRKRFANGSVELSRIYGYDKLDGKLVINEESAKIVRRIYDLYLSGCGVVQITCILESEGYRTMNGDCKWNKSTVTSILKNEKYMGDSLLQKSYCEVKVKKRNTGQLPQYYIEDSHEPIVTREEFERVQQIFEEKIAHYNPWRVPLPRYPLSGKIICGECGAKYVRKTCAKGKSYATVKWSCRTKDQHGKSECESHDIKDEVITALFIEAYNECLDANYAVSGTQVEEEKLQSLLKTERELRELHIKGYITDVRYREETETVLKGIREQEDRIRKLKERSIKTDRLEKTAELTDGAAGLLLKATVKDWTVTFEFANGYTVTKEYTNGRAGNVNGKTRKQKT